MYRFGEASSEFDSNKDHCCCIILKIKEANVEFCKTFYTRKEQKITSQRYCINVAQGGNISPHRKPFQYFNLVGHVIATAMTRIPRFDLPDEP